MESIRSKIVSLINLGSNKVCIVITNTRLKYYVPNFITFFIYKIWRSNYNDRVIFICLIHFVNIFIIMSWVNNAAHSLITLHPLSFEILMLFPFQCCHTFDFKKLKSNSIGEYSGLYGGKNTVLQPSPFRKSVVFLEVWIEQLSINNITFQMSIFWSSLNQFIRCWR